MADRIEDKTLMLRYLLGQLPPDARDSLEERYLADTDLFEELVASENDLIDSYVRGQLSGPSRLQFESRYLATPELRERVKLARTLADYDPNFAPSRSSPGWWKQIAGPRAMPSMRFALSGIFVAVLIWATWMTVVNVQLRRELEQTNILRARLQQQQQELQRQIAEQSAQLKQVHVSPPTQEITQLQELGRPTISLALAPGLSRSGGKSSVLPISTDLSSVLLLQTGSGPYSSYSISLETPDGKQILKRDNLKVVSTASGRLVPVLLPSNALSRGDYIVRLTGIKPDHQSEAVDTYIFRAVPAH